jgi:hypothetical protein
MFIRWILQIKRGVFGIMIIKYCPNCSGRPYTKDFLMRSCPYCNADLQSEMVNEDILLNREEMKCNNQDLDFPHETKDQPDEVHLENRYNSDKIPSTYLKKDSKVLDATRESSGFSVNSHEISTTVTGKISQYSSTGREDGAYRRLLPVKIYQALVYRQRLEDVLHRFTVRVEHNEDMLGHQNYTDVPVNVHGTISGGLQLVDNAEVEVHGKYNNGVLMADSIHIINNGHKSKVGFQRSVKAITYGILSALMLAFVIFVAASSDGNFF